MPVVRWVRAACAVSLGIAALVPFGASADPKAPGAPVGDELRACKSRVSVSSDNWARIAAPRNGGAAADDVIVDMVTPPGTPKFVWTTNGKAVRFSDDAGCTFDQVYPGGGSLTIGLESDQAVLTHLVAPRGNELWLAGHEFVEGVAVPHVAQSEDAMYTGGGAKQDFRPVDDGLPAVGTPVELAISSRSADLGFVLIDEVPDVASGDLETPARRLYRLFIDQTVPQRSVFRWEAVPSMPAGLGRLDGMVLSMREERLWVWSGDKYASTTDRGATWDTATAGGGDIGVIDSDVGGNTLVYSGTNEGSLVEFMATPGKVLRTLPTPILPTSAFHGFRRDVYVITGPEGTWGYDYNSAGWVRISPKSPRGFDEIRMAVTEDPDKVYVIGRTRDAMYRWDLYEKETFLKVEGVGQKLVNRDWFIDSTLKGALLTPESRTVTVRPGERKPAPLTFTAPPSGQMAEVFFLMDSTSSMGNAIAGLKAGVVKIAKELEVRTRGRACFGLGEIKDFGAGTYGENSVTAYRRLVPIEKDAAGGCVADNLEKLQKKLTLLNAIGGDQVLEESQTVGLVQAVRGDGSEAPPVPEGQGAGFTGKLRVIVMITDAGFKTEPTWTGFPTIERTVSELRAAETFMVGIAVDTGKHQSGGFPDAVRDLQAVAEGTGTVAQAGGVQCDEEGLIRLGPGDPLVCQTENTAPAIAPAITSLLLSVPDLGSMEVEAYDPEDVVVEVNGTAGDTAKTVSTIADLKFENRMTFRPVVTCRADQDGQDIVVDVIGRIRTQAVKLAKIVVQCRAIVPPPPPPPVVPDPIPPVPPRPVIPPPPIPQFQPPPVQNPPAQMNMNAGFSQQEEQQFQLAAVTQGAQEGEQVEEEVELAMTGLDENDAAAAQLVLGCSAIVAAAGGAVFAQRRRVQRSLRPSFARLRR